MEKNEIAFLFACGNIIQDSGTKKFTYIDVFTAFVISKEVEFIYQNFWVAGRILNIDQGENKIEVKFIDATGEREYGAAFVGGISKTQDTDFAARFDLVKLDRAGKFYLRTFLNGKQLNDGNRFYLEVRKQ